MWTPWTEAPHTPTRAGHKVRVRVSAAATPRVEARPPVVAAGNGFVRSLQALWHDVLDVIRPEQLPAHVRARKKLRLRELEVLADAREEFAATLNDIWSEDTAPLLDLVQTARTMQELWHLRAGIFGIVSRHHSQEEAAERLAQLNRHFPTRSIRSGFAPLDDTP